MYKVKQHSQYFWQRYLKTIIMILLFILGLTLIVSISIAQEEEEEDEKDEDDKGIAQDFGWVAVGLFSMSIVYVFFYQVFMKSNKYLP